MNVTHLALPAILSLGLLSCEPSIENVSPRLQQPRSSATITFDPDEVARLEGKAIRQGPVEPPVVESLPCMSLSDPGAMTVFVEALVNEQGKIVQAKFVNDTPPRSVVDRVSDCVGFARLRPATMDGQTVSVYFNMALRIERDRAPSP